MPPAVAYDPLAPEVIDNPYPWYEALREQSLAYHGDHRDIWVISRYDDVLAAARAHDSLSSSEGITYARAPIPMMITIDPPDHTRLRRLVARDFTPRAIAEWQGVVDRRVAACFDELLAQSPVDYMQTLAFPLPVTVIAEVLGIPPEDHAQFKVWSDGIVQGFSLTESSERTMVGSILDSLTALKGYLAALIEQRRRAPADDLLSRLVDPGQADRVSDEELFWFCMLLLVAGNETTTNLLGNMVLALREHPDQWRLLQERPELVPPAIEEVLRFDSPIQGFFRTAFKPYEVAGTEIPVGARVLLLFASANRDPRHYERADELLVDRNPADHLAFGSGIHLCLGAHLARLEGAAVLRALLDRTKGFDLAGEPVRGTNPNLRGLLSLPLTFARN
ncbi:MAG: cytochrome P450 [Acidimicrobiia bacterium]|nr:cytochrome P450 [Acidimicrobiia bacterium]